MWWSKSVRMIPGMGPEEATNLVLCTWPGTRANGHTFTRHQVAFLKHIADPAITAPSGVRPPRQHQTGLIGEHGELDPVA